MYSVVAVTKEGPTLQHPGHTRKWLSHFQSPHILTSCLLCLKVPAVYRQSFSQHLLNMPQRTRLSHRKNWEKKRLAKKAQIGVLCMLWFTLLHMQICNYIYAAIICQGVSIYGVYKMDISFSTRISYWCNCLCLYTDM